MFLQFLSSHCPEIEFDDAPSEVCEDNKGTIDVVEGGTNSKKLRHLHHHKHYGRDLEEQQIVKVKKIHTDSNTADLMTKYLIVDRTAYLMTGLKIESLQSYFKRSGKWVLLIKILVDTNL